MSSHLPGSLLPHQLLTRRRSSDGKLQKHSTAGSPLKRVQSAGDLQMSWTNTLKPSDTLSEVMFNHPGLLKELSSRLDRRSGWCDLAQRLGVEGSICDTFPQTQCQSPTDTLLMDPSLFYLTVKSLKTALRKIRRQDVVVILEKHGAVRHLTDDTLVRDLFKLTSADIIGEMASQLDVEKQGRNNWKELAGELHVPRSDYLSFGKDPDDKPTEELFNLLVTRKPGLTMGDVKKKLGELLLQDVVGVIESSSAGSNKTKLVDFLEDLDAMREVSNILEFPRGNKPTYWRRLGRKFEISNLELDQMTTLERRESSGPTAALFHYLQASEPNLSVADLVEGLHQMKRNDLIQVLKDYNIADYCI